MFVSETLPAMNLHIWREINKIVEPKHLWNITQWRFGSLILKAVSNEKVQSLLLRTNQPPWVAGFMMQAVSSQKVWQSKVGFVTEILLFRRKGTFSVTPHATQSCVSKGRLWFIRKMKRSKTPFCAGRGPGRTKFDMKAPKKLFFVTPRHLQASSSATHTHTHTLLLASF